MHLLCVSIIDIIILKYNKTSISYSLIKNNLAKIKLQK